jgi:outer membrane protein insertion porin family
LLATTTYLFSSQAFKEIKFEGLTQISTNVAQETLSYKKKNQYEYEEINNDIKKFFDFGYFDNIWVTVEDDILTYHFEEKPFIAKIEMTGYKNRDDELKAIYESMGIKKGTMYTPKKLERARQVLLLNLEAEGYINSTVETEIIKLNDTSLHIKFHVNKGEEIIITKVTYRGAKALDEGDFEAVIGNKEVDCCFTWFFGQNDGEMNFEQLQYDSLRIKDLYLQNGYLDAKVTAAFSKIDFNTNTATIEYTIVEGKQYKINDTVVYVDESILKADDIYAELKLQKQDIFNISELRKDQEYIKTQVANKGYAFANVKYNVRPDKEKNTVDLIYNVEAGDKVYINDVIISGNSRTLDRVIRRDIYLAPKDLFNLTDFKDSKNALQRRGYFETVEIKQKRVSATKMDLIVEVEEAPTGNLIFGGGYGSYDGWMLNVAVNDKNIFGSGLNLGFKVDYSGKKTNYTVSLLNPAIRDSKYSGSVNIHKEESIITNDTNSSVGDKTTAKEGFGIGIGRALSRHTRVGVSYAYDKESVTYEVDTASNTDFTTSAITPYINFNNTDDFYIPRSGITAGTSLKYAGVGGTSKYMLSSTYFKYFHSLENLTDIDIIFRYKNSLKVLEDTGNIPDGITFYMGGANSLRGYSSYAFQPDNDENPYTRYFTNAVELSFPLIPSAKMRWELFYDYGMIGETTFNKVKRSGAGAAISWYSPVGPLQFIFSRALDAKPGDNTSNFEFSLGSKF